MKKVYEKPQVYMERFELAEHIAGCSLTMNHDTEFVCTGTGTIDGIRMDVFADINTCDGNNAAHVEGYCYTNGSINVATINS